MSTISSLGSNSLQPPDYAQFQQNLFNKADADGDGVVSQNDLQNLLQTSPRLAKGLASLVTTADGSAPTAQDIFKKLDADGNGSISLAEFKSAMTQVHAKMRAANATDSTTGTPSTPNSADLEAIQALLGDGSTTNPAGSSTELATLLGGTTTTNAAAGSPDLQNLLQQFLQTLQQQQAQSYTGTGAAATSSVSPAAVFAANA